MMLLFVGGPIDGAFHQVEEKGNREVRVKVPEGAAFYAIDNESFMAGHHVRGIAHYIGIRPSEDSLIDIFEVD